uniref:Fe2OG dioxygenase domain-containing protein n=1 Tax=Palpitomonas bilix TaxID=652834 RepID=A0A7S3GCN1_9EUKA|mmetsp:Transcript_43571/g.113470  ORF Transcript_43571/g.113470 Transcript_43571/m.113470 type:complete len:797 (+) Transcript_43571:198-2588(+)
MAQCKLPLSSLLFSAFFFLLIFTLPHLVHPVRTCADIDCCIDEATEQSSGIDLAARLQLCVDQYGAELAGVGEEDGVDVDDEGDDEEEEGAEEEEEKEEEMARRRDEHNQKRGEAKTRTFEKRSGQKQEKEVNMRESKSEMSSNARDHSKDEVKQDREERGSSVVDCINSIPAKYTGKALERRMDACVNGEALSDGMGSVSEGSGDEKSQSRSDGRTSQFASRPNSDQDVLTFLCGGDESRAVNISVKRSQQLRRVISVASSKCKVNEPAKVRVVDGMGRPVTTVQQLREHGPSQLLDVHDRYYWRSSVSRGDSAHPSRIVLVSLRPLILFVENLLTPSEADRIVRLSKKHMRPSPTGGSDVHTQFRTSEQAWMGKRSGRDDKVFASLRKKAMNITSTYHEGYLEDLQVLHYQKGQHYHTHWDESVGKDLKMEGVARRAATFLVYLTDVEEGGETYFPYASSLLHPSITTKYHPFKRQFPEGKGCNELHSAMKKAGLGRSSSKGASGRRGHKRHVRQSTSDLPVVATESGVGVSPRKGSAVLFYNTLPAGDVDVYSLHAGCDVLKGDKWASNYWISDLPLYDPFSDDNVVKGSMSDRAGNCNGRDCEEVEQELTNQIVRNPRDLTAVINLAVVYLNTGRHQHAINLLDTLREKLVQKGMTVPLPLMLNLAAAREEAGDYDRALADLQLCAEHSPRSHEVWQRKGAIEARLNMQREAERSLNKALALHKDPDTLFSLATLLYYENRQHDATKYVDQAISMDPTNQEYKRMRSLIRTAIKRGTGPMHPSEFEKLESSA